MTELYEVIAKAYQPSFSSDLPIHVSSPLLNASKDDRRGFPQRPQGGTTSPCFSQIHGEMIKKSKSRTEGGLNTRSVSMNGIEVAMESPERKREKVTLESNVSGLRFHNLLCHLPQPSRTRSRLHSLFIGMFRDWSRELRGLRQVG